MDPQTLAMLMKAMQGQGGGGGGQMGAAQAQPNPLAAMASGAPSLQQSPVQPPGLPVGAAGGVSSSGLMPSPAPQGPPPTNAPLPQRRGDSGANLYNREPTREMQTGAGMPKPRQALPMIPRNDLGALLMPQGQLGMNVQPPSNPGISSVLGQFLRPQS